MTRPDKPRGLRRPYRVAEEIKRWVVEEGLVEGARLPGEAALMDRFGMSKGTIREAMRVLEAQGLVTTRTGPGGGTFVGAVSEERARALLGNYFYFKSLSIADIYQLRRQLEPELAADLAGRLSEAQLGELEALITRYDRPAGTVAEERDQHVASLAFHERLAQFSANPLLGFLVGFTSRMLSDLTVWRRLYAPPNHELWRRGRAHQIELVGALRAGDAEAARAIMAAHMASAQALMEEQEAQVLRRFIGE
ncbi:FadR/GntR family transcriptional regulator [Roseivivax isoporae]|uniref:GntR family transcriptional regulator n=1 Tax=Roseivivax isoporae LMG 25204 TaxID=1449351 RepID=X7F541_9RHOB|nr:FCD domain-containing protein [Roseivivax isoporae]ETX27863.1 GntR family transcriptional regulator [Roseivivax isoporae LMG 25204]